ncbi:glutathione peroxidase [Shewanella yunxiaonensis]|uniref:Glutathione peroxidase n=1 Tax=Shewanella yunxiaonensis TaxID=2829809 RepID=A0ABX7YW21_9GAMM|nr:MULTISPECIES: glutathione peroxidase [Shewanella]MDF0532800.1 glutathione peroxidase [Shewanella sp. A32]QUN06683.1 glutathione peroxidase [Shewanella yunxiaonensis]
MKGKIALLLSLMLLSVSAAAAQCPSYLNLKLRKLHSQEMVDLCALTDGKPVLIVNTASHCGFTPQFKGLEALHEKYRDKGLVVIGFPSNDFFQEEKQEQDTAKICYINYGVKFTMLATSSVKGRQVNPVFAYLNSQTGEPKWNFFKYLVSADGKSVQRFSSRVTPDSPELTDAIDKLLATPASN